MRLLILLCLTVIGTLTAQQRTQVDSQESARTVPAVKSDWLKGWQAQGSGGRGLTEVEQLRADVQTLTGWISKVLARVQELEARERVRGVKLKESCVWGSASWGGNGGRWVETRPGEWICEGPGPAFTPATGSGSGTDTKPWP